MTRLKVPEVISAFGSIGHMLEESQRDGDVCLQDGAFKCQRHRSGRKYGAVDLNIFFADIRAEIVSNIHPGSRRPNNEWLFLYY